MSRNRSHLRDSVRRKADIWRHKRRMFLGNVSEAKSPKVILGLFPSTKHKGFKNGTDRRSEDN